MSVATAKIRWQCRRGMLELDMMLLAFLDSGYDQLTPEEQRHFEQLLTHSDPELYAWALGQAVPEDPAQRNLIAKLRSQ